MLLTLEDRQHGLYFSVVWILSGLPFGTWRNSGDSLTAQIYDIKGYLRALTDIIGGKVFEISPRKRTFHQDFPQNSPFQGQKTYKIHHFRGKIHQAFLGNVCIVFVPFKLFCFVIEKTGKIG